MSNFIQNINLESNDKINKKPRLKVTLKTELINTAKQFRQFEKINKGQSIGNRKRVYQIKQFILEHKGQQIFTKKIPIFQNYFLKTFQFSFYNLKLISSFKEILASLRLSLEQFFFLNKNLAKFKNHLSSLLHSEINQQQDQKTSECFNNSGQLQLNNPQSLNDNFSSQIINISQKLDQQSISPYFLLPPQLIGVKKGLEDEFQKPPQLFQGQQLSLKGPD